MRECRRPLCTSKNGLKLKSTRATPRTKSRYIMYYCNTYLLINVKRRQLLRRLWLVRTDALHCLVAARVFDHAHFNKQLRW